ncbi:ABC transporter permease [Nonomuraea angiospora]|uniref:ABC transporter permease n=1 Tax=Nonomuraea angiospora TaxID=46172 RepID=UPI0029A4D8E9|nr:ABC transporter permease [Nonomuraea angiospora]MDX3108662.1 ABC transporter permease [Nonomuraea angiospora]
MLRLLSRRLIAAGVLLVVITAVTFLLTSLVPDPTLHVLGATASPEQIALKRHELGLDRPVTARYLSWLGGAIGGDLGVSWFTGLSVDATIAARLPITLSLALIATAVSAAVGVGFGTAAAIRRGWLDRALQAVSALGFAVPGMWIALLLVIAFSIHLRWFPATGYVPLAEDPGGWARSLVLPVTAIAAGSVAAVAAQTRNAVAGVLGQDYVRTLRSRGLPRHTLLRHVLRNAAPAALTVVSLQFIGMLGGALVVEQIFAIQGLGTLATSSSSRSDIPVVLGVVVVGVLIVLAVNLAVDLLVGWLDPKARRR